MSKKLLFAGLLLSLGSLTGVAQLLLGSTPIVADVVAHVAGPNLRVEALIPRGVDPHAFEPTPQDVQRLLEAELIFINGAGLEEGLAPFLALPEVKEKVVDLSAGLPLLPAEDGEHAADPHVWWDPTLVVLWVERIREVLSAHFPLWAQDFAERASQYREELVALDSWIRQEVEAIPPEHRNLVTDHYVLTYFAQRYGFQVVGALIPSHTTLAEPSPKDLAFLEEKIRALRIPAIFVIQESALAQRVAQDTSAKLVVLPAGTLSETGGYLEMMREAVRRIVQALKP